MNYPCDYEEQEQSAVQISFDLSMEESFNLKKGSVDDSQNSKRSRKDQMGEELDDSVERAFKAHGSSFMEESVCIDRKDAPRFAEPITYNHLQSSPHKLIHYSNGSHRQSSQNPPSTITIDVFDSDLAGTFGSLDSQRSQLKHTVGNKLDPRGPSLAHTNRTYKPMPEQVLEVNEDYAEIGLKIMVSKEKKPNPEIMINDSIKLQGSGNLGQAFRKTACFNSDANIKMPAPAEKPPAFSNKTINCLPSSPSIGSTPKLPPNPSLKHLPSLSPDQNKASLKKCLSAENVAGSFTKKMSLRDYMELNKLSGSRRNRAKQIIQTASTHGTRETHETIPSSVGSSRRKGMNSPSSIECKIKNEISNNINKIQGSLQRTLQLLGQSKSSDNKQENIMLLYNLNRLLKDKLMKAADEVSQFLNYHEHALAS